MKKSLQHTFRIFALATIFVASLSLMSFDDTKDFETAKEYKQIGTELAIDTKKVLMLK